MLISHRKKFITIDIPKTATRSIRESLTPLGIIDIVGEPLLEAKFYQHGTAIQAKKQFEKNEWNWEEYLKFTIVRNPWTRYFSFFTYFLEYKEKFIKRCLSIRWGEPEIKQGKLCVDLFEKNTDHQIMKNIINSQIAQSEYFLDESGKILIEDIARFENFNNEFKKFCRKIKVKTFDIAHANKSKKKKELKDVLDQELIDLIAEKEKKVIEMMNYSI